MKLKHLLVAGLCGAAFLLATVEPAHAQRSREARQAKPEVLFPEATRAEPKVGGGRLQNQLQKVYQLYDKDKFEEAITAAEALANDSRANAYEKAQAFYIAGFSAQQLAEDDYTRTIGYLEKAVAADGLGNNSHFQTMQQLGQLYISEEKYAEALTFIDRFLDETKQRKPEVLLLRGNALFRLERYPEAIESLKEAIAASAEPQESWQQLLMAAYMETDQPLKAAEVAEGVVAKKPDDKRTLLNLISIYMQADQPKKAGEVFDRLRANKLLTESRDYENAFRLLANIDGREADAVALINEGLGNGILQPSHDVYSFLGQSYYFSERIPEAIEAWKKAAPLGKDGETYLNLAKVLVMEERYAESKAAAQQALAKGVKKPGDAWMTIARAEFGPDGKNRAAILAAYREAAKYPETKAQAERSIAQMSR